MWPAVLGRRASIQEHWLSLQIAAVSAQQRQRGIHFLAGGAAALDAWQAAEAAELAARQTVSPVPTQGAKPEEMGGRETGSLAWRTQRGETGSGGARRPVGMLLTADSLTVRCDMMESGGGSAEATAAIIGDAPLVEVDGALALDLRAGGSFVEVPASAIAVEGGSFTVEAWVAEDEVALLQEELHENPLVSRHGVASGWELRLGTRALGNSVCFLVTIGGQHIEVSGVASNPQWLQGSRWRHIAGVFDAGRGVVQAWEGTECVAEAPLPAGAASVTPFDGPINIARNPQWTERHCPCWLRSVRLTRGALPPEDFMKASPPPGCA